MPHAIALSLSRASPFALNEEGREQCFSRLKQGEERRLSFCPAILYPSLLILLMADTGLPALGGALLF